MDIACFGQQQYPGPTVTKNIGSNARIQLTAEYPDEEVEFTASGGVVEQKQSPWHEDGWEYVWSYSAVGCTVTSSGAIGSNNKFKVSRRTGGYLLNASVIKRQWWTDDSCRTPTMSDPTTFELTIQVPTHCTCDKIVLMQNICSFEYTHVVKDQFWHVVELGVGESMEAKLIENMRGDAWRSNGAITLTVLGGGALGGPYQNITTWHEIDYGDGHVTLGQFTDEVGERHDTQAVLNNGTTATSYPGFHVRTDVVDQEFAVFFKPNLGAVVPHQFPKLTGKYEKHVIDDLTNPGAQWPTHFQHDQNRPKQTCKGVHK